MIDTGTSREIAASVLRAEDPAAAIEEDMCLADESSTRTGLLTQAGLEAGRSPSGWEAGVYRTFEKIVSDQAFPCTFARAALKQGSLTFFPVRGTTDHRDVRATYDAIGDYLRRMNALPARQAAFNVLVVLVKPEDRTRTVGEYHAQAWDLLQRLHDVDEAEWPEDVPGDPHDLRWAYCLHGVPLFINVSTPAHVLRRSRNLGPSLALVINPRAAFDVVPGTDSHGLQMRAIIRARTAAFDGQPVPDGVGVYGDEASREWLQYCLPEENTPRHEARCPLTIRRLADRPRGSQTFDTPNQE